MIVNLSYGNYNLHKIVNYQYNDATHVIVSGTLGAALPVGGLGPGTSTGYAQTIGADTYTLRVQDTAPYVYVDHTVTALPCNLLITTVAVTPAMNGVNGTINVTVASGSGTKRYSINGGVKQASPIFANVVPGNYIVTLSRTEDTCNTSVNAVVVAIPDLQINLVPTNCSANGVDDGTLELQIVAGSGDFSANFVTEGVVVPIVAAPPTGTTRINLAPASYQVTVTDNVTGQEITAFADIVYPAAVPPPVIVGSVFEIPFINGLSFVVRNANAQQLDNVLFINQRFGRYKQVEFANPRIATDTEKVQFYSNFPVHTLELLDYCTDELIRSFDVIKVQENIGSTVDFAIILKDNGAGQTRVYLANGATLPVAIGDTFTISNSLDGFDGDYSILAINLDVDLGLQYFVITAAYGAITPQSYALGTFLSSLINYDVYESAVVYFGIATGKYYFKLTAVASNIAIADSEPVEIRSSDLDTVGIVYSSVDNGDGVTWQTGYRGFIRVPGFIFKRLPGGIRTISRNSNYSPVKVSSKSQRFVQLDVFTVPPYLHEKLAVIFDQDYFSVNGLAFQMVDGYPAPKYIDMYPLADAEIKIEQLNWFNSYNGSDSITPDTDMSCACDTIDLLKVSSVSATITLDVAQKKARVFSVDPAIAAPKTWALANDFVALSIKFIFSVSGAYAQTFPANFKMNDVRWDKIAKTWTPEDFGTYQGEATFDGANWELVISQSTFV